MTLHTAYEFTGTRNPAVGVVLHMRIRPFFATLKPETMRCRPSVKCKHLRFFSPVRRSRSYNLIPAVAVNRPTNEQHSTQCRAFNRSEKVRRPFSSILLCIQVSTFLFQLFTSTTTDCTFHECNEQKQRNMTRRFGNATFTEWCYWKRLGKKIWGKVTFALNNVLVKIPLPSHFWSLDTMMSRIDRNFVRGLRKKCLSSDGGWGALGAMWKCFSSSAGDRHVRNRQRCQRWMLLGGM